eukprot:TRINITY_DN61978_c0_g1_i1.p1 TRINITY_DN61978_c0_g1~~TRINITY_DN61978_c0_g1_i1.p1  ORF type:complete len:347 (-),score=36.67 TRINITY_DN61978_c0_g1_i1:98-1138(-)
MGPIAIIVHGGAWAIPDTLSEASRAGCERAAAAGYAVLHSGGTAIDAVEVAIRVMEDDPVFDAGYGSVLTSEGKVEMDASIQSGSDLQAGAVACVSVVRNPISLAKLVMQGEHTLIVGDGAEAYARDHGMPIVDGSTLITQAARDELDQFRKYKNVTDSLFNQPSKAGHDTVGCCATDQFGDLAAGTSTGGITAKRPGRVGDSPLLGSGCYADNERGACSTTGHGESITKVLLANRVLASMDKGQSPSAAVASSLAYMKAKLGSCGGAICISPDGVIGACFNTPRMAWAKRSSTDDVVRSGIDNVDGVSSPAARGKLTFVIAFAACAATVTALALVRLRRIGSKSF